MFKNKKGLNFMLTKLNWNKTLLLTCMTFSSNSLVATPKMNKLLLLSSLAQTVNGEFTKSPSNLRGLSIFEDEATENRTMTEKLYGDQSNNDDRRLHQQDGLQSLNLDQLQFNHIDNHIESRNLLDPSYTEDWSSGSVDPWLPGVVAKDHSGDITNNPRIVGGELKLSSRSSCFSAPYNGVGTKVTRNYFLSEGEYKIEADIDHQVTLWGFCQGGTNVRSRIIADGNSIAQLATGVSRSCSTNSDSQKLEGSLQ